MKVGAPIFRVTSTWKIFERRWKWLKNEYLKNSDEVAQSAWYQVSCFSNLFSARKKLFFSKWIFTSSLCGYHMWSIWWHWWHFVWLEFDVQSDWKGSPSVAKPRNDQVDFTLTLSVLISKQMPWKHTLLIAKEVKKLKEKVLCFVQAFCYCVNVTWCVTCCARIIFATPFDTAYILNATIYTRIVVSNKPLLNYFYTAFTLLLRTTTTDNNIKHWQNRLSFINRKYFWYFQNFLKDLHVVFLLFYVTILVCYH